MESIPPDLDADTAKAVVLDTCKSALEMDIAQMERSLDKWGFKVEQFERLSEPSPDVLQEYMVWIACNYGIELARTNMGNWLQGLLDFPWLGKWDFMVTYQTIKTVPRTAFAVRVTRWTSRARISGTIHVQPRWANF